MGKTIYQGYHGGMSTVVRRQIKFFMQLKIELKNFIIRRLENSNDGLRGSNVILLNLIYFF